MDVENQSSAQARMTNATHALRRILVEIGWAPEPVTETGIFSVDFGPPHLPVASAVAAILTPVEQFVIYFNFGVAAAPECRDEVGRFITRANLGLIMGNFEMDLMDGRVRFKASVDFRHAELPPAFIRNAILSAMNAVEMYADPLLDVVSGKKNAAQAIAEAETESNQVTDGPRSQ